MDTIPKIAMIAGTTAQTSASNISRISETLGLLTSAAKDLPKTVQNLQSTITSFNQWVQKFPETNQLHQELVDQLKKSLTKLPDIIKALPGNLKSITNVVTNLESKPFSIKKNYLRKLFNFFFHFKTISQKIREKWFHFFIVIFQENIEI
jgi:ABC-type transporter Mla subunit MlaD